MIDRTDLDLIRQSFTSALERGAPGLSSEIRNAIVSSGLLRLRSRVFGPAGLVAPRPKPVVLPADSGWTISIALDLSEHGYSIVAYPTGEQLRADSPHRWFPFADGRGERRVFGAAELHAAISEILAAEPPVPA